MIAVDCDDVLVATTPYFIDAYNKAHGTNIPLDQSHDGSEAVWGAHRELQVKRLDALTKTEEYRELGPTRDEVAILRELSSIHSFHLVTARKQDELELTQRMLERDLPGVFASLDFVGWTGSKGEVCRRIEANVLIDDNFRHLQDAVKHGLPKNGAILFGDYPWNNESDESLAGMRRCVDWNEVKVAINEITNG
ncbi:MAG TPA: hypothetical protein VFM68_01775 [Candidatus Saccharimonadales bacterium]|nr:hypothetical protein [Candidatus Saccharimonadales bacterium]